MYFAHLLSLVRRRKHTLLACSIPKGGTWMYLTWVVSCLISQRLMLCLVIGCLSCPTFMVATICVFVPRTVFEENSAQAMRGRDFEGSLPGAKPRSAPLHFVEVPGMKLTPFFSQVRDNAYMLVRAQGAVIEEPAPGSQPSRPPSDGSQQGEVDVEVEEGKIIVVPSNSVGEKVALDEVHVSDPTRSLKEADGSREGVGVVGDEVT